MDKKKQDIYDFDYPELDLSSDDDKQPDRQLKQVEGQPAKKIKTDSSNNGSKNVIDSRQQTKNIPSLTSNSASSLPVFFPPPPPRPSGPVNQNWVPPPPVQPKPQSYQSNYNQQRPQYTKNNYNPTFNQQTRQSRQKNNLVYVKNIPKNFNTQQKLMTFFKNQGIIKQIKTNQSDQSATIRFLKDQHALKFLKSNKFIFNRSFIVYGSKDNLTVTPQQIQDRITDEQGIIKKAEQTNMKVLKEKAISQIAQQIRALYFFQKYLVEDDEIDTQKLKEILRQDLSKRVELKNILQGQSQDFKLPEDQFFDEYDWSLIIKRQNIQNVDKKALFAQFLKYGPIINLQSQFEIKKKTQQNIQKTQQNVQNIPESDQIYNYEIKILFLSLKNLWSYYNLKRQEQSLEIQGKKVQQIFDSRKLKTIEFIRPVENIEIKKIIEAKEQTKNIQKEDKIQIPINFGAQNIQIQVKNNEQKAGS